jgi:N-acyl-L-homoserine lactone synthetase
MIRFINGVDLFNCADLATSMFEDRKSQFHDRLKWPVTIENGRLERDEYDAKNPMYIILEKDDGSHGGSMRLMPTVGRTMINEHFLDALGGNPIIEYETWECTRFCMSPSKPRQNPVALFAAAGYLMRELAVKRLVAVFDNKMKRNYRLSGASPNVIGEMSLGSDAVYAGAWDFTPEQLIQLTKASGYRSEEFELSLANSNIIKYWPTANA